MTPLAPLLEAFFTDRLRRQLSACCLPRFFVIALP